MDYGRHNLIPPAAEAVQREDSDPDALCVLANIFNDPLVIGTEAKKDDSHEGSSEDPFGTLHMVVEPL